MDKKGEGFTTKTLRGRERAYNKSAMNGKILDRKA
jgi:hypothetical protein